MVSLGEVIVVVLKKRVDERYRLPSGFVNGLWAAGSYTD